VADRRRPTARAAPLPARQPLLELGVLRPTLRSLLIALALIAAAGGAYVAARDTAVFAVRSLDVRGGTPAARAAARTALAPELGRSLLRVGEGELASRLAAVSLVGSFRYDRAFPHTLRVTVRAERPALVLRQGTNAYLISSTSRVLKQLTQPKLSRLPRMYVAKTAVDIHVGATLASPVADGAAAVAPLASAPLPGGVRLVSTGTAGLQLVLGGGFSVRLGDTGDLRLKLAIARRILSTTGAASGPGYLDVSVPERPVLNPNPQVAG
jgi:cell division protein FtsQ